MTAYEIVALATLQFSYGGLFDSRPADHRIHLIRSARSGTPGPTLCDIDRFAKDAPGWGIGGGVTDPEARPCTDCVEVADDEYPGLPVWGSTFRDLFAEWRPAAPWDTRGLAEAIPWDNGRG